MSSARFEPAIPATEQQQDHGLDRYNNEELPLVMHSIHLYMGRININYVTFPKEYL
jgi:hypothetical protein